MSCSFFGRGAAVGILTHLKLFFISRSLAMTSTGSVLPVACWILGSCERQSGIYESGVSGAAYAHSHENVMSLWIPVSDCPSMLIQMPPYLLIANSKSALRLLVVLGKCMQCLDGLALKHRDGKLDVGFRVFVAGL